MARIAALVLFLLAAVLAALALYMARAPAPAAPAPVAAPAPAAPAAQADAQPVMLAARDLAAGTTLQAADLQTGQWAHTPASAYADADRLIGQTLRFPVRAGEPLLAGMLATGLAEALQPGERAVTIAVDEISGAAHRVQPGDVVDVFFLLDKGGEVADTQARLLQSRLRVLAYGSQTVDGPAAEDKAREHARGAGRTAMLAVPLEQVNELLLAARSGRLQLALRAPQDTGEPDPGLFPQRPAVLAARAGLDAEARARLDDPANRAYAGAGLAGLAGAPPAPAARPVRASAAAPARTVEVLRGDRAERVPY